MVHRSRWTVQVWWESPSSPWPSRCRLRSSTQPSAAQSHAERPHQQVPAGGCCYLSIGRLSQTLALLKPLSFYWTQPHPCTVPLSQPNMFKNILFFSNSSFLEPAQVAGGGELVPGQQLLWRWPLAVLQFLLLKHWFQMVLDTKMEKSKPPCETSFQKKRISLKKGGRCDQKTQPLPEQKDVLLQLYLPRDIRVPSKGTEKSYKVMLKGHESQSW